MDDVLKVNLDTFEWDHVNIVNPENGPGACYSGACSLVCYKEREYLDFEKVAEVNWGIVRNKIKYEGLYFFGGVSKVPNNNMYVLSIGSDTHKWKRLETTG